MKKPKTLYVSDLDGTLLGTDSRISPQSSDIISDLSAQGALITVATARTPASVVPLLTGTRTSVPAIVMTGCALWNRTTASFESYHFIPQKDITAAIDSCRNLDVHPFTYAMASDGSTLDVYHGARSLNPQEEKFYLERRHLCLKRFHLGVTASDKALHRTMLCFAMGLKDSICRAADAVTACTSCSLCCYPDIFNNDIYNLEIYPPGVNKASAILALKKSLGAERLVVFGDNLNDLPMLAVADVAVAVGNAFPQVKEAADIVIEPNYTDAVARFIEKDFIG